MHKKPKPGTEEWFRNLRFDQKTHLGLGDVRLTIGMQEEISQYIDEQLTNFKVCIYCDEPIFDDKDLIVLHRHCALYWRDE